MARKLTVKGIRKIGKNLGLSKLAINQAIKRAKKNNMRPQLGR